MGAPIEFKTDLKLMSAITIIVGSMIGSGILKLPAAMLAEIQSPWVILVVFVVAALLTVTGALTFAEMSSMFPRAGGQYHFLREGLGPSWSYLFGWTMFWVIQTGIIAAVAVVFAQFTEFFVVKATGSPLPGTPTQFGPFTLPGWGEAYVAISAIVVLGIVNYFGVRHGGMVQNLTTFGKAIGLLALVAMVFLAALGITLGAGGGEIPAPGALESTIPDGTGLMALVAGFGLALAASMFAYDGWPQATYVAGEVQNPKRNVPLALLLGPIIAAAIYFLVTFAYFLAIPADQAVQISQSDGVIAIEAAKAALGEGGATFISVVGLVSVFGTVNAYVLTSPRVFYSLARDGALVPGMAKLNKNGTPGYAMLLTVIWSSLLVMTGLYIELAIMVVFGIWLFYIPTAISHLRMRFWTMRDVERPFRTPAAWFTVSVFFLAAVFISGIILWKSTLQGMIALVLIGLGVPAYFLQRNAARRREARSGKGSGGRA